MKPNALHVTKYPAPNTAVRDALVATAAYASNHGITGGSIMAVIINIHISHAVNTSSPDNDCVAGLRACTWVAAESWAIRNSQAKHVVPIVAQTTCN